MKDFRLNNFKLVVSELVSAEIEDAPEHVRTKYAELLELNPFYERFVGCGGFWFVGRVSAVSRGCPAATELGSLNEEPGCR